VTIRDPNPKKPHVTKKQQQVLSPFATQNASLYCGTISHSLIRVDATIGLLSIEEVLPESWLGAAPSWEP